MDQEKSKTVDGKHYADMVDINGDGLLVVGTLVFNASRERTDPVLFIAGPISGCLVDVQRAKELRDSLNQFIADVEGV